MALSKYCVVEIQDLSFKAQKLARGDAKDRAEAQVLQQRIATLRDTGISSDEARAMYAEGIKDELKFPEARYGKAFWGWFTGKDPEGKEVRAILAGPGGREMRDITTGTSGGPFGGQETITWTSGASGGYTVPIEAYDAVIEGLAQVDPLLDKDVCGFEVSPGPYLNPKMVAGYDLTQIAAARVAESTQSADQGLEQPGNNPQGWPTVSGGVLRSNIIYRLLFRASMEAETDIPALAAKLGRALGVAFGRALGRDAILGSGASGVPQGLYTALTPSVTIGTGTVQVGSTQTTGNITNTDIDAVFFKVNRIYRDSPKCSWLMPDSVYQKIRNATDNQGRPLLKMDDDKEVLMGKRVLVSPSLPLVGGSPVQNGALIFGDLDHFKVRISRPTLQRLKERFIDFYGVGYVGRVRMDSLLFDPSGGTQPPVVLATVNHS